MTTPASIVISAGTQDMADALTNAVNQGLTVAGFSNVTSSTDVSEPDTMLTALRNRAPELFDTPVEIVATVDSSATPDIADEIDTDPVTADAEENAEDD